MSRNYNKKVVDLTVMPDKVTGTFFGNSANSVPDEVRVIVPLLHKESCSVEVIRACIQQVVAYMKDNGIFTGENGSESYKKFQKNLIGAQTGDEINSLFTAMYSIMAAAISSKEQTTTIVEDLKRMHIPTRVSDDLGQVINKSRATLEDAALKSRIGFASLGKFRWRIDVIISSGSLSRLMRPSILMEMTLSNGHVRTFEVSVQQFNQLRYGVAKMLKDMQMLERHPVMRIEKEEDANRLLIAAGKAPQKRASVAAGAGIRT
jgi:COMM domain containing 5